MKFRLDACVSLVVFALLFSSTAAFAGMVAEEVDIAIPRFLGKAGQDPCTREVMLITERGNLWRYTSAGWSLEDDTFPEAENLLFYPHIFYYSSVEGCFMTAVQYYNPTRWHFWKYDSGNWEQIPGEFSGPSARYGFACTWDNNQQELVLFGGHSRQTGAALGDTWIWTGTQWEQQMPTVSPPAQGGAVMVDAPMLSSVQLFGEDKDNHPGYMAVWTWDGSDWTYVTASAGDVSYVKKPTVIRDTDQDRTIMFGGYVPGAEDTVYSNTYFWDDTSWTMYSGVDKPPARYAAPGFFFEGHAVICGGLMEYDSEDNLCDTWNYNDVDSWTQLCAFPPDTPYSKRVAMTWDPVESRGVLLTSAYSTPKAYEWKNHSWIDLVDSLPDRFAVRNLVYDPNEDIFLLQAVNISGLKYTYIHDRTCWTEQSPDHQPEQRESFPLVYHPVRNAPVIFGGLIGISYVPFTEYTASNKMYEWVDNDWQEIPMADPRPPEMFAHAMAYDSHRGRLVVAGGTLIDNSNPPSKLSPSPDVWEWDGSRWHRFTCSTYPTDTGNFPMNYDPVRRRCVLPTSDGTIWEWDGANWHTMATGIFGPESDIFGAAVYDPDNAELVIHASNLLKTYTYADSDTETCGDLGVSLDMPQTIYTGGDTFYCDAHVCNTTGMNLNNYPLFVILDVYGTYFWGPGWTTAFDSYLDDLPVIPEGETDLQVIPPFTWPDDVGSAAGINFIGAVTNPEISILYGEFSQLEFGWTN